jgi:hypothetical protein
MKRCLLACLLLAGMSDSQARGAPSAPAAAAAQPAQRVAAVEPNALRDAGLRIAQAIEGQQAGQLWDSASGATKKAVTRDAFVAGVGKARNPLGQAQGREWVGVSRRRSSGGKAPPGEYANAEFLVALAGNRVAREMVSFRLDEDGIWRFAGYVIQ